jgi:hypothetical protein
MNHHVACVGAKHGGDFSLNIAYTERLHGVLTLVATEVECIDAHADGIADEKDAVRRKCELAVRFGLDGSVCETANDRRCTGRGGGQCDWRQV